MPSHLHLEKINKNYEDLKALNNLAFDAHQGQLISLVGANGSGKTTLLRIMAGLDFPNNGKIIFNGKELNIHDLRKIATLVFQKSIMFNTSVFKNVAFGLKVRGVDTKKIRDKVFDSLSSVSLQGFDNKKANNLSGGDSRELL